MKGKLQEQPPVLGPWSTEKKGREEKKKKVQGSARFLLCVFVFIDVVANKQEP
jgi:hypothetical protein